LSSIFLKLGAPIRIPKTAPTIAFALQPAAAARVDDVAVAPDNILPASPPTIGIVTIRRSADPRRAAGTPSGCRAVRADRIGLGGRLPGIPGGRPEEV
jgi:hypothetical protein